MKDFLKMFACDYIKTNLFQRYYLLIGVHVLPVTVYSIPQAHLLLVQFAFAIPAHSAFVAHVSSRPKIIFEMDSTLDTYLMLVIRILNRDSVTECKWRIAVNFM